MNASFLIFSFSLLGILLLFVGTVLFWNILRLLAIKPESQVSFFY